MFLSLFTSGITVAFACTALAHPSGAHARNGTCQEYKVPVSVSSTGLHYTYPPFKDNFDVVALIDKLTSRNSANFTTFSGPLSLSGNYSIAAEFCSPVVKTGKENSVLLTSHGLGYYRNYWNPPIEVGKEYNFVDYALNQGYSVFNYDRLGTGHSSRVDGYNEGQTSQQIAILTQLAQLLRSGQYTGNLGAPSKIVLVGHSFGSFISNAAIAASSNATNAPPLADALILTGFSYNLSNVVFAPAFNLKIASTERPREWGALDNGYLVWNDVFSEVDIFFHEPDYSHAVANYTERVKQAIAIGELLTFTMADTYSPAFEGPVLILNGVYDIGTCDGDCVGWVEPYAGKMFPRAEVVEVKVQPAMSHGINFHYNATGAFGIMTSFLDKYLT